MFTNIQKYFTEEEMSDYTVKQKQGEAGVRGNEGKNKGKEMQGEERLFPWKVCRR